VGWALLAVIALHVALSAAAGHRREYDPLFHFFGGVAGAYCLLRVFKMLRVDLGPLGRPSPIVSALVAMFGVVGAWEVVEFASDRVLGTHVQLGSYDTVMDVVLGIAGALCALAVAAFVGSRSGLSKTDDPDKWPQTASGEVRTDRVRQE